MSYINTQYKHVFIHVPKTGGTSMYRQKFVRGGGHQTALELVPQQPDWFSWGFVRNPYDRLYSVYCAVKQHPFHWKRAESLKDFHEFVIVLQNEEMVRPHTYTMTHFLCNKDEQVMVDFVGRFENIDEDWKTVCERIGVEPVEMHHLNQTKHGHWKDAYDSEMIAAVNRMYEEDFKVFGYEMLSP